MIKYQFVIIVRNPWIFGHGKLKEENMKKLVVVLLALAILFPVFANGDKEAAKEQSRVQ